MKTRGPRVSVFIGSSGGAGVRAGMRIPLLMLMLGALAACTTPEQLRQADEQRCQGYGFKGGTDAFSQCLQQESIARRYGWWPGFPSPTPWRY
jgi:hypothetical protein